MSVPLREAEELKFTENDVEMLLKLLVAAEKRKWRSITDEINRHNASSHEKRPDAHEPVSPREHNKNLSPTYVVKQFHNLFGMPPRAYRYGVLGSSLPYAVAARGWDDLKNLNTADQESEKPL